MPAVNVTPPVVWEEEHPTHLRDDLWIFQVSAGIVAALCVVGNALMIAAFVGIRRLAPLSAKNCLFFSQACGQLIFSPWALLHAARLAELRYLPTPDTETLAPLTSSTTCLAGGSLPVVVTSMAPTVHTLLLSLDLYLPLVDCLLEWQHLSAVAVFAWMLLLLISLMPWMGWNSWRGFCYLPMVWTSKYVGVLSMLFILMVMACAYLLLGMFIHSRLGKESNPQDEKPSKDATIHVLPPWESKARLMCVLGEIICILPLLLTALVQSEAPFAHWPSPLLQLAYLARHDSGLAWSLVLAALPAALMPLFCLAAEPPLCAALGSLGHGCGLSRLRPLPRHRLRRRRPHRNVVTPAPEDDEVTDNE